MLQVVQLNQKLERFAVDASANPIGSVGASMIAAALARCALLSRV